MHMYMGMCMGMNTHVKGTRDRLYAHLCRLVSGPSRNQPLLLHRLHQHTLCQRNPELPIPPVGAPGVHQRSTSLLLIGGGGEAVHFPVVQNETGGDVGEGGKELRPQIG